MENAMAIYHIIFCISGYTILLNILLLCLYDQPVNANKPIYLQMFCWFSWLDCGNLKINQLPVKWPGPPFTNMV